MSEAQGFAIEIEHLSKKFAGGVRPVFADLSLKIKKGLVTYILGPSGVGKSVLLKHVLGFLRPDCGDIWVAGQQVGRLKHRELERLRMRFGMLFQNSALFDDLTVYENVAFPLREHSGWSESQIHQKVVETLSLLGMEQGLEKLPSELSGGMRKRVGLARAVIREPELLLYDEPTTGLDPVIRATVDDLIVALNARLKLTSVVISHDISSALALADEIAFLDQGQIVFSGTPAAFRVCPHKTIQEFLSAEERNFRAFRVSNFPNSD